MTSCEKLISILKNEPAVSRGGQRLGPWEKGDKNPPWGWGCVTIGFFLLLATYKHRSRQFLSGVTISPGAENLLALVSFGQPVVKDGSGGPALAQEMKKGLDKFDVVSCQIESAVFDGVYFHCSIEKHFNSLYGLQDGDILYSHDALHKSGLVDTHMAKKPQFAWVADITHILSTVVSSV